MISTYLVLVLLSIALSPIMLLYLYLRRTFFPTLGAKWFFDWITIVPATFICLIAVDRLTKWLVGSDQPILFGLFISTVSFVIMPLIVTLLRSHRRKDASK